jgi:hypothetical protein
VPFVDVPVYRAARSCSPKLRCHTKPRRREDRRRYPGCSDDLDPTHPTARFTRKSPQPLDLDPTDLNRVKPESSQVNPAGSGVFAEKPLSFPVFTDISSRRDKTFTV